MSARLRIKICGVTLPDDAARVAALGVEFIGLNFWPRSKRYLAPARAPLIAAAARGSGAAALVGVFVDPELDEVVALARELALDVIQLHGDESPDDVARIGNATGKPVWKAVAVAIARDIERLEVWPADAVLLDAPSPARGGTGVAFDWELAAAARRRHPARRLVLAGGLTAANVAHAIAIATPWAVDVASGVEAAPGIKDADKLAAFIAAVAGAPGAGDDRVQ
jgi:phosphoribosylanthranilate isomerase